MNHNVSDKTCGFECKLAKGGLARQHRASLQWLLLPLTVSLLLGWVENCVSQPIAETAIAQPKIQVVNEKIVLTESLQTRLASEINQTRAVLYELAQNFSFPSTEEVGIVYTNESRNLWRVQFTFSGLPLTLSEDIMLPTRQVLQLKKIFEQTKSLEIGGKTYTTTGFMRQLGPTLHPY
jgi:hypothetical protein